MRRGPFFGISVTILRDSVFCHFERREKSDLRKQVILSKAKDPLLVERSLALFGTMLRIGFLAPVNRGLEMTCEGDSLVGGVREGAAIGLD
jgi:hypothetical protein